MAPERLGIDGPGFFPLPHPGVVPVFLLFAVFFCCLLLCFCCLLAMQSVWAGERMWPGAVLEPSGWGLIFIHCWGLCYCPLTPHTCLASGLK